MSERPNALGIREFARWTWRQLTSMRTALVLLIILAIVSIPGSIFPQRSIDPAAVGRYRSEHPELSPILDRLGFFNVYTSPLFGAVYVLLVISLIGCILPRVLVYYKALRARPPKAPRNLDRLGGYSTFTTSASVGQVLQAAKLQLKNARIDTTDNELSAEKGYLREFGNLVFHLSIVFVLIGFVGGSLFGYKGAVIVVEGTSFSNTLPQFDEFSSGSLFDTTDLTPFALKVDSVDAEFELEGEQRGAPRMFRVEGSISTPTTGDKEGFVLEVNHPLSIGRTTVHLVGIGYAPVIKVTDSTGQVAFDGPVVFLPEDGTYFSSGVVKVPDAKPEGLGLQGFFLPTAVVTADGDASMSAFPAAANPYIGLFAFSGDLNMDSGQPQSVYFLDTSKMKQFLNPDGSNFRVELQPGEKTTLPDGAVVEFTELRQFARLQIASMPFALLPLVAIVLGTTGLMLSLYVRPRRWWIRTSPHGVGTKVEIAALDKVPRNGLPIDVSQFAEQLETALKGK